MNLKGKPQAFSNGNHYEDKSSSPYREPSSYRTLGPLDAQLPSSLDSNGISYFARHGPVAASVPHTSQFGIPETYNSFSSSSFLNPVAQSSSSLFAPGASPRTSGNLGRSMFERRASAIDRNWLPQNADDNWNQQSRNQPLAPLRQSSVTGLNSTMSPGVSVHNLSISDDEDGAFAFEEDFVPSSLNELLTPAERQRRASSGRLDRMDRDGGNGTPPSGAGSNNGSPSSSRFGALFLKHKEKEIQPRNSPSNLPPIGSPLARGLNRGGAISPNLLSPPRIHQQLSGLRSMSTSQKDLSDLRGGASLFVPTERDGERRKEGSEEDTPFQMDE